MNPVTEEELKAHQEQRQGKRVTAEDLEGNIKKVDYYLHPESQLTICVITLLNGFTVTGESACADPAMFKQDVGERLALAAAKNKIWPLMGYALKQELFLLGSDFKTRLVNELNELTDKLNKLSAFVHGNVQFARLDPKEQGDLQFQLDIMTQYQLVLNRRIKRHI